MAVTYKILGQSAPSATTETDLYTVPASTEAIIPIKDGSVPVKMSDSFTSSMQSTAEMAQQNLGLSEAILVALNEMIRQQKETNAINQKILRANA